MIFNLDKFPVDLFQKFTNNYLDEMTGYVANRCPKAPEIEYNEEEAAAMKSKLKSIFLHLTYSPNPNDEDLSKILEEQKCNFILQVFKERKLEIALALMKDNNASLGPILDNFDWKLNWVIGNNVSTSLRYPLLNLNLSTLNHCSNSLEKENINVELTKEELDTLIESLEHCINK